MNQLTGRSLTQRLRRLLQIFPAVGLVGPRQVGKSTLVRELLFGAHESVVYIDLERAADRALLDEPARYLTAASAGATVVIDEVQTMPALFTALRPIIDADRRPGRFVLLGSASPELLRGAGDSLAGRISYAELPPLTYPEVAATTPWRAHWLRGGYPLALLTDDVEASVEWREAYVQTYVSRELPRLGSVAEVEVMGRLLAMLAAQHGDLLNLSNLARSLGVSQPTARRYVGLLERSYLLRLLRPYHVNVRKRLVKSPKAYLRDSGLLHVLLGVDTYAQLLRHPRVGASYEGYVVEQVLASVGPRTEGYFYRTQAGAEIDLVLRRRDGRLACAEIKFSDAPQLQKGFYHARTDLGPEHAYLIGADVRPCEREPGVSVTDLPGALGALSAW